MNRRTVLLGSGVALTAALAGCSSDETDAGTGNDDDGDGDGTETVVDDTITDTSNYSVTAESGDVISFDVSVRGGEAVVRVVTADGTVEPIHREAVTAEASFEVPIDDAGVYEVRVVTQGATDVRAEVIRTSRVARSIPTAPVSPVDRGAAR